MAVILAEEANEKDKVVAVITKVTHDNVPCGENADVIIIGGGASGDARPTITCRECRKDFGSLSRHLSAAHQMTVEQYHAKHGADAPINPAGVKPGRKAKAVTESCRQESATTDDLLVRASGIELVELDRLARDGFTDLDSAIQDALLGRSGGARETFALGYAFACRCVAAPAEAEKLPRWGDAAVQAGTNPYYRPLKCLTVDVVSHELTSVLTQWAAIYRDAASRDQPLTPTDFADELKRRGRRPWYDSLPKKPRDNPNPPKAEPKDEEPSPALSTEEARALLQSQGFTDPSAPVERMDAKAAAALLADQGAQLEPEQMSLEAARKLFPSPQTLILWRADLLPSVKGMLEQMEGFVRILDFDSEEVKKIVGNGDNDL